ncbi:hypothetical protein LTR22_024228 [Elasticomyces elasticus]|nr:hypothetical protein LTR22_024228 [Elasticomyces elasticus]
MPTMHWRCRTIASYEGYALSVGKHIRLYADYHSPALPWRPCLSSDLCGRHTFVKYSEGVRSSLTPPLEHSMICLDLIVHAPEPPQLPRPPCSRLCRYRKPFDFRFIPNDISHFQKSPVRRRRKRLGASASQHSANDGLACSTDISPPASGPYVREKSPESEMHVPKQQATTSTMTQLYPAERPAPKPPPSLLDEWRHVEAPRNGLEPPAMPQHDAKSLPLPMPPSPTGSECSTSPVASQVMHCSATAEQEPADGPISSVPPAPIIETCDEQISNKHTLPISRRPTVTRNIEVHRGSADRDSRCRPGPVHGTADTADIDMAPVNVPVSVKWRSNPIVLIRLSRTIRDDYAKALDYRENCDLADDPPQTHVHHNDKGRRCLRAHSPRVADWCFFVVAGK